MSETKSDLVATPSLPTRPRVALHPRPRRAEEPVKIVYIAGIGRSGSTLLTRTLGGTPGIFAAGELMHFFGRGLAKNELCACGSRFRECAVWGEVVREVEAALPDLDPALWDGFRHRLTESRQLVAFMLAPWQPPRLRAKIEEYRRLLRVLYGSVQRVTGCRLLVDASKNVGYGSILLGTPGVRLYVVHLVRDSRGVTFSLEKRKRRPGVVAGEEHLDRHRPAASSFLWSMANLFAETLARGADGYVRLRYTDFVRAPGETVARVLDLVGEETVPDRLAHLRGGALRLGVQHILAGNPVREATGEIRLMEDVEWRHKMPPGKRHLVTALTFPLLLRYGYLGEGEEGGGRLGKRTGSAAGVG